MELFGVQNKTLKILLICLKKRKVYKSKSMNYENKGKKTEENDNVKNTESV